MSGEWKRGTVRLVRHRQTKGPVTDRTSLNNRATPRLYSNLGGTLSRSFRKQSHKRSDTVGEFIRAVREAGFPLPRAFILARLRPIARLREFANNIHCYWTPQRAERHGGPRPVRLRPLDPAPEIGLG